MTPFRRSPSTKIAAVISDVDGTLVTEDKILTARAEAAVADLRARGIAFTIISSRPPRGLRMLVDALGITTPIGGFNGGVIARPDLSVITGHLLPSQVARCAIDRLDAGGVQPWVFAGRDWFVRESDGPYIDLEERTVGFPPKVIRDFGAILDVAVKIVGVSTDFELLARCERDMRAALVDQASVACSQPYYLDITHPLANKGIALSELAKLLAVPLAAIAVIGDGRNDVAMFERGGLSIVMGNAAPDVRRAADFVTDSNNQEGFATAIERFILGGERPNLPHEMARTGDRAW
jgi:Cof subfamily protein (haloacid dehalogenase superfamily)